ncbi:hypothetical protein PSAL_012950 [Pseudooceanicola algae]|uniref:Uncharacterized protein n=1 Tax=Pseudooceanicola algae TaxID=1537215 RepID=A0A418SCD2_9RHOB|nr:hypothetical protein PSAL_012950 [Pseudooceanicola algae]
MRLLRRLVTALMLVMIFGLLSLVGLIVIRFAQSPAPALPAQISLPDGVTAEAVTMGSGWFAVVTKDQRILIFDADSGKLRQEIDIAQ